ncbi:MAG: lysophospholipase [Bacteroidales bacterium]|nr:lysophospholipase [Bacteroidales bacterium]MDT8431958.1 alpha/beta hydrolase [Bacteroidales bacterium]
MAQEKQSFFTTPDGINLFLQEWTTEKPAKAVMLYIHGLGSHGGRLDHWANRFTEKQVAFVAYDQRGHGRTDGKRGAIRHIRRLTGDVATMVEHVRTKFPGIPMILYGHSLGGLIALSHALETNAAVDGLVTTSPWLRLVHPPSKALVSVASQLRKIAPGLTLSNGLDADDISSDKAEADKYRDDPLVHDRISLGLFFSVFEAGNDVMNHAQEIKCPFLIMHGTGDRITSHEASSEFAANSGNTTTLKLWEGSRHELHHEPNREEVFDYVVQWMKRQKLL